MRIANSSLTAALGQLAESAGVEVAYSPSLLGQYNGDVDCNCSGLTVGEALDRMLVDTPFAYREALGQVFVYIPDGSPGAGQQAASAASATVPVRQATISGTITSSETGQPLSGAQVVLEGTTRGALTAANGRYSLVDVPAGTYTVVARIIGYQEARQTGVEVGAAGEPVTVNMLLTPTALALEEVIVVGYGEQSRATVTGSVSSVSANDLERNSSSTTAGALVGRIQGINARLTTSGTGVSGGTSGELGAGSEAVDGRPGAAATIQIRNMGEPLVIIDGVPQSVREFNQLNAADIDNISVLKDASASVYGLRAANGVILVTTKRGSVGSPILRVDGFYGWQDLTRNPFRNMMNAYEYQFGQLESQQNLGQPRNLTPEELELWRIGAPGYESYDPYPDIVNNPNAPQHTLNLSVSGGSEGTQYYLSFGNVQQDYVMKDNSFARRNIQANLQTQVFNGFTLGTELSARFEEHRNVGVAGHNDRVRTMLIANTSFWPIDTPWANMNRDYIRHDVRYLLRSPALMSRDIAGWQDDDRQGIAGNFWAEYEFPFGMQARGTYSYRSNLNKWDLHRYTWDAYTYDRDTDTYNLVYTYPGAFRSHQRATEVSDFAQLTLSYGTTLGSHSISGLVGLESTGGESTSTRVDAVPPTNYSHLMSFADQTGLDNRWDTNRRASYLARFNYDYDEKYLFELLGRYDGSYLYDPDRRWGLFPGVSAGWRITQEPFLRDRFSFLDDLKLRASWGQAGQELGVSPWGYLTGATYGVGNGSIFGGEHIAGVRPRGLPVRNLSWVTSTMTNAGIDVLMFDNRVALEFDVFERELSGVPAARYDVLLPTEVGYSLPNENLNSEAIRGLEGVVRWTDRVGDLSYSIAPNFTLSRRKILSTYKPRYGNSWDRYRNGTEDRWAGVDIGHRVVGQFESMEQIANHPVNNDGQGNHTMLPGDLIFEDANGDGVINEYDQRPIGRPINATPILSFGITNSFTYKGVNVALDWSGGSMFTFEPYGELGNAFFGGHAAPRVFLDRWHRADPFDDRSEWIPGRFPPTRVGQQNHVSNRRFPGNEFYRYNVTYMRLHRAEVSYNVPPSASERLGIPRLMVYSSVSNPLTFDNVGALEIDPEVAATSALVYPTTRLINVGFRATLGGGSSSSTPVVPVAEQTAE